MLLQMLWWSPSMLSHIYTPFWKLASPVLRCPSFVFKLQWPFPVTPLCIECKCPSKEDLIFRLQFLGSLFVCNTLDIVPHSSFVSWSLYLVMWLPWFLLHSHFLGFPKFHAQFANPISSWSRTCSTSPEFTNLSLLFFFHSDCLFDIIQLGS